MGNKDGLKSSENSWVHSSFEEAKYTWIKEDFVGSLFEQEAGMEIFGQSHREIIYGDVPISKIDQNL